MFVYTYIYIFRLDIAFKHVTALSLSLSFYRNLFIYLIFISIFTINLPIGLKCHVEQLSSSSRIIDISLIEKKKKKEKNFRNYEFEHGFSRSFNINHRRRRCFITTSIDPSTNSLPRAYEEKNNGRISRRIARREINRNRKSLEWENLSGKFTRNEYNSECRGRISRIKRGEELRNN